MPLFFFHLVREGQRMEDIKGSELPDLESAYVEAIESGKEMLRESMKQGERYQAEFEVTDETGKVFLVVPFLWTPLH